MTDNCDKALGGTKPPVVRVDLNTPIAAESTTPSRKADKAISLTNKHGKRLIENPCKENKAGGLKAGQQDAIANETGEKAVAKEPRKRRKRFYASKSVSEKMKASEHRLSSNIIYMHVQAKTTEEYSDRQLHRLPIAYAMKLNDVGQQHRANTLLDQENQKVISPNNRVSPTKQKEKAKDENKDDNSGNESDKKILPSDTIVEAYAPNSSNHEKVISLNNILSHEKRKERPAIENTNENSESYNKKILTSDTKVEPYVPKNNNVLSSSRKESESKAIIRSASPSSSVNSANGKTSYPLVYEGPPTEKNIDWPQGWLKRSFERPCKTRYDHYWYTPKNRKLRSIVEVKRMITLIAENGNDEFAAWVKLKERKAENKTK